MARDLRERDNTTLGRATTPSRATAPSLSDRSGSVRAIALDPDRYAITDVLGEGGMGEVRRCQDSLLDRSVALKVVRPDADIDDFETRFLREARVQARLAHPGVVPVYDVGRDDNGRVYFTMKRVEGVTLEDVILQLRQLRDGGSNERGNANAANAAIAANAVNAANAAKATKRLERTYDQRQLLTAFARACLTVDYVHSRGVLHRDLKPANLMLGAYGEVYVLDWGLAKLQNATDDGGNDRQGSFRDSFHDSGDVTIAPIRTERDTEYGVAMGTPAYMAPEQAAARPLDPRADVFSLGAILYEILTLDQLLDDHAIQRIRARQRLQIHPRTGKDELDAIITRATAFDARDRFPSARALHDAVEDFLAADEELRARQRRAAQHVERAKALSQDDASRSAALEELGAALALVPEDNDARAHLVHLLRHPPRKTPHEVVKARIQHEIDRLRRMQTVAAGIYALIWAVAYPAIVLLGGVQHRLFTMLTPAIWVGAALVTAIQYWTNSHRSAVSWSGLAGAAAVASTSLIWGPMFIVPGLAIVVLFGQLLVAQKRQRVHITYLTCAAVAIPSFLAIGGYWNVYQPVSADMFSVHGSVGLTRVVFYAGLLFAHLAQTVFGARFAGRYRDALDERVFESAMSSWQLANLVPRAGRDAGGGKSSVSERRTRPSLVASDELSVALPANDAIEGEFSVDGDIPDNQRYTRLAHIGQTAHTEIWRCVDRRLGRAIDMHVSKSKQDDVATLAQARASGRLDHPAIAPVYDVGTNEQGRVYYAIKSVRGVSLERAIAKATNNQAYRRTLAAFGQVCLAIAYAHERGVYHRALDPSSIVLGGFGEVYVGGWSAKPFESVRERLLDVRALKHILGQMLDAYRAEIPGIANAANPRQISDLIEAFLAGTRDAEALQLLAAEHLANAHAAAERALGAGALASSWSRESGAHPANAHAATERALGARTPAGAPYWSRESGAQPPALRGALAWGGSVGGGAPDEERVIALREVGRAVRLAPGNQDAMRLLVRLLTEPPKKAPPAVLEEVERLREQRARGPARASAVFGAFWLTAFPIVAYLIGVRSPASLLVIWAAWALVEVALLAVLWRRGKSTVPWPMLATMFAGIVTASLVGPFFLTPIIAAFATMSFVLVVPRGWRTATMFLGSLIVLVPVVLGASGAYSAGDVSGDVIFTRSMLSVTSHQTTMTVLTAIHLLGLVFAAEYASRFRDRLDRVEQAFLMRAWQLKKLVRA